MFKNSDYMKKIAKLLKYFGILLFSFSCLNPLMENENKNFFPNYIPGIDTNTKKAFYTLWFLQIPIIYLAIIIMLSHVYMFLSFTIFGTSQIQILNFKLKQLELPDNELHLNVNSSKRLKKNLIDCIKYHHEIKSFMSNFNELLSTQNMLEFMVLGIVLCFNLFFFENVENLSAACLYGCVVFFNIFNVFMFCLHGNNLTEEV